ncbi:MAG: NACHT domain-containing protein [Coleofasciculus sp. G3-WIS-01]|uniref:NACHT C-terminal helical domain 2-containing protein n=1 Tax=Coleofasciculus sp. G3-WIS-01 TaxID=3069528 RepID=UPI0032FEFE35
MPRGIKIAPEHKKTVRQALRRRGYSSQQDLANTLGLSLSTIHSFFNGKPVDSINFEEICETLGLERQTIQDYNIETLVQNVRQKIRPLIQQRCGTMRVLDMTHPIGISDIYTNVNILEKITGRRRLKIADLLRGFDPEAEDFDHWGLNHINTKRLPGLEAVEKYPKLMVLGKPGSGKTTFLKYLAIQCSFGTFMNQFVPICLTIKDFAEATDQPDFLDFLIQHFSIVNITGNEITQVIQSGQCLILLDGLDEMLDDDANRCIKQIRYFSHQYCDNQFVITCRIAAQDYTFDKFTEVEVADFNGKQIKTFVEKWYKTKDLDLGERFIEQLKVNPQIQELATNPLLLTLLCLEFEDSGDFPADRAELYKRGIATLLLKWDAKRGIIRDQVYKKLSVQRKQNLLSQIAFTTFERKDYFFKQRQVEHYIADYIRNLPDAETDPDALQLDSEAVLKSIEAQHGLLVERAREIYSFSHLTFQEYFTARKIVTSSNPQTLENALRSLVSHITEKSWREVFFLSVGMLQSADYLLQLMKQQIDQLVATDAELQRLLQWVHGKSNTVHVPYKPAAVRAFYFNLARNYYSQHNPTPPQRKSDLIGVLDCHFHHLLLLGSSQTQDIGLDELLSLTFERASKLVLGLADRPYAMRGALFLACDRALNLDPRLDKALQELKQQLPNPDFNLDGNEWQFKQWWQTHGISWTEQLSAAIIKYRQIGYPWQLNSQQNKLLKHYYDANRLLVDCLNSDCYVSREVRQEIEDTLLLPMAEIEKCRVT